MRKSGFFLLIGLFAFSYNFGQVKNKGIPFFKNYLPEQYNANAKNLLSIQDRRGVLYFANADGILSFDGTHWNTLKLMGNNAPTALNIDANGRIYVGMQNDFGYLKPSKNGEMIYVSLKNQLPPQERDFKEIHKILIQQNLVLFQTAEKIFIKQANDWQVLKTGGFIDQIFLVNAQIYLREWGTGLLKLNSNILSKVPGSHLFAYDRISTMLSWKSDNLLIISRNKGGVIFYPQQTDSSKSFQTNFFEPKLNTFLINNQVSCGIRLNSSQFALGTNQNGLIILQENQEIIQHFHQGIGLVNNTINDIYVDNQNNIWLSLDTGIAYVGLNSPFSVYNEKSGLQGSIMNSIVHQGKLYVGTSKGIFYQDWQKKAEDLPELNTFKEIKNSKGHVGVPYTFQQTLLYSHHNGVLAIEDSVAHTLIPNEPALSFTSLKKYPNYLLVAKLRGGLSLLVKKENTWIFKNDVQGISQPCNSLIEDSAGDIWFSDYAKGVYKIRLNADLDSIKSIKLYNQKQGLPPYSRNSISLINNQLAFITSQGIYKYVPKKDTFEPNNTLSSQLFAPTYVNSLVEDKKGNRWFLQFGKIGFSAKNQQKPFQFDSIAFNKLRVNVLTHITPIDEENILFATQKGLFHYTLKNQKRNKAKFHTLIHRVSLTGLDGRDSVIFAGAFVGENESAGLTQPKLQIHVLPYFLNNIRLNYGAIWYEDSEHTIYQYFLEGLDEHWSEWTNKTEKSYTNLPEGTYTFWVKAKNIYGEISLEGAYTFVILPPWYRTYTAYSIYLIISILLIFGLIHWNTWRLRKQNIYLAKEIEKGLKKINRKNLELETKNIEIDQAYQNVKLLNAIGQDITANLTVENIVDTVYENINRLMDATSFGIGIYNPHNQTIDFIGAKEKGETLPKFSFSLSNENRLAVWCFQHQEEVFLNNYQEEHKKYVNEYQAPVIGDPVSSVIYQPLFSEGISIGVITVQSFEKNAYTLYHLNILKNLAIYIGIALENAQAYQKLSELNQEKNHLIGIVAHDLRNPLHNIYGLANVIQLNSENLTKKQADYLQKIIDSVARVNLMINKILDMKAIENQQVNIQWSQVNLLTLLQQVKENYQSEANRKNINLQLDCFGEAHIAELDENYTLQIFENLISNALKFSQPNEEINLRLIRENGTIRTEIQDNGPGIKAEEQKSLFGKFQKLSAKPTAGEHSVGLGLSIVKKYVEVMQGKVWCESESGKGATFIVEFKALNKN